MKKTEKLRLCKGHNSELLQCSGDIKESNFFVSWSKFYDGKVPYCKDCVQKIYEYFLKETGTEKRATYFTLMKIDIPFIEEIYDKVINKKNNYTISTYITELHRNSQNKEIWGDFSSSDVNLDQTDLIIPTIAERKKELASLERTWGKQDCVEDYDFLNDTFERYTKGVEFANPQQEDLYKDLCRDRLLLRKINDGRYNGDETLDKIQNRISKTMSILKIDQYESNKPKSLSEQSLFEKIRLCDENNVKDVYSEPSKYYDLNKIQYYNEKFSLRPLANMLVGNRDFSVNLEDIEQYEL